MGCDIHGWIEVKKGTKDYDKYWESVCRVDPLVDRNYSFFACFFGVRNDYEPYYPKPHFSNRGLPKGQNYDFNKPTLDDLEKWGGDAHSVTHFYLDEVVSAKIADEYVEVGARKLLNTMSFLKHQGFADVRAIVWFDN